MPAESAPTARETIALACPYGLSAPRAYALARVCGVHVRVQEGELDAGAIIARIERLLGGAPASMRAHLRRVNVLRREAGVILPPAACDFRGAIWFYLDPPGEITPEILDHELGHSCAGHTAGPPAGLTADWERAREDDLIHQRRLLGAGERALGGLLIGAGWITTYARSEGAHEDWADACALFMRERRRAAPLIGASIWGRLMGAGGGCGMRFFDLWPARARLLVHHLGV